MKEKEIEAQTWGDLSFKDGMAFILTGVRIGKPGFRRTAINMHDYVIYKNDVIESDNKSYAIAKLKEQEYLCSVDESIEFKRDYELHKTEKIYRFTFSNEWYVQVIKTISDEILDTLTPLDVFKKKGFYKLIENETEFNEYMKSNVSCNDWCRIKLIKKMKELDLRDGFINAFADLIGNDLERYKTMIELSNECKDKDILMYMLTQKFSAEEK